MKISIVTVNYNGNKTLKRTIESILNQTYNNIEYIIIDGKSTDNSVDIIKSYEEYFKKKGYEYRWISEKDTGIYNAMNKGIRLATGKVIGILNSDDWYEKDTVNLVANEFKKDKELEMTYGILRYVKNNRFQKIIGDYNSFGKGQYPTVFLKKEVYEKYEYFNEKYKIAADGELLLRLKNNKIKYKFIPKILTNFSMEGVSNKIFFKTTLEELIISYKNDNNKLKAIFIFIYNYLKYFTKFLIN